MWWLPAVYILTFQQVFLAERWGLNCRANILFFIGFWNFALKLYFILPLLRVKWAMHRMIREEQYHVCQMIVFFWNVSQRLRFSVGRLCRNTTMLCMFRRNCLNYHDTMIKSGNFCFAARRLFVLFLVSKLIWSFFAGLRDKALRYNNCKGLRYL